MHLMLQRFYIVELRKLGGEVPEEVYEEVGKNTDPYHDQDHQHDEKHTDDDSFETVAEREQAKFHDTDLLAGASCRRNDRQRDGRLILGSACPIPARTR